MSRFTTSAETVTHNPVGGPAAERLLRELGDQHPIRNGLIGGSQPIETLLRQVFRLAQCTVPVLIVGEVGSGKELVARAIHLNSDRSSRKFVAESCAQLREPLFLSRLFGHQRGAFTGASNSIPGAFEEADGGVLYLDEVADLPLSAQACLVRALETGEYRALGGSDPRFSDLRVIASTTSDLRALVGSGLFRRDLYFRLRGAILRVPTLRDRRSDILPLAEHFVREIAAKERRAPNEIADCARRALVDYDWPGNVRELRMEIQQALAVAGSEAILAEMLLFLREPAPDRVAESLGARRTLKCQLGDYEAATIRDALHSCGGNKSEAARRLGVTRRTLYRRIEALRALPDRTAAHCDRGGLGDESTDNSRGTPGVGGHDEPTKSGRQ